MNARPTFEEVIEAQNFFALPTPVLVEKDWYVVQALAAIAKIDSSPFQLVFGGGTSLSRAHRLIQRMSEDIDLKIVGKEDPTRGELRKLRALVTEALLAAGFSFDPENRYNRDSKNENRYTIFRLPYEPLSEGQGILRPEIQIEIALWPLRQPAESLSITSFINDAFGRSPELEALACVSVAQTAAEKFVALTRRVAKERNMPHQERDPTLVRHIYDLQILRPHYDLASVAELAKAIMPHDAEIFGQHFHEYRVDSFSETQHAIEALESDPHYGSVYDDFQRDMVYGSKVDFIDGVGLLREVLLCIAID